MDMHAAEVRTNANTCYQDDNSCENEVETATSADLEQTN